MIAAGDVGAIAGISVRGVSHVKAGLPNQDSVDTRREGEFCLLAVADGHGASPHYRSDRGSRFAVRSVLELLSELVRLGDGAVVAAVPHLARDLVADWRLKVEADIRQSPVRERAGFESHAVYGATCLAAAIGPGLSLFLQIGDGDIVASGPEGEVEWAVPRDPALTGPATYSLSQPDAADRVHVRLYRTPHPLSRPDFALLATDGLAKSYPGEVHLMEAIRHMRSSLRDVELPVFVPELEPWLSKCSAAGSRDDVSMALFSARRMVGPPAAPKAH